MDHQDPADRSDEMRSTRPRVHFTPRRGWLNDPNGLVHLDGVFHLFYQHHPGDTSWGPMHWGHATSTDLVSWEHRPIALAPDHRGTIYSGSAVIDEGGTAALGDGALVALYTSHRDGVEEQGLAWSLDGGTTFAKLPEPVLRPPPGQADFRDPRVLRFGADGGHWVMLLAVGRAIWIHTSADLTTWTLTDEITGVFSEAGTWETPELIPFDVDGATEWVLVASIWDGAPAGGSGVQAIAGEFDGSRFTPSGDAFWVDHGPSFYAPQAWRPEPDGRRIWIGWMANWHTVEDLPAGDWRGQMSIPRELRLRHTDDGPRLAQAPVSELSRYRGRSFVASPVDPGRHLDRPLPPEGLALDLLIRVRAGAGVEIRCDRGGGRLTVEIDPERNQIGVTRALEDPGGPGHHATLAAGERIGPIRVVLDVASVEVFAGTATISCLLPSSHEPWSVSLHSPDDPSGIEQIELHELGGRPSRP